MSDPADPNQANQNQASPDAGGSQSPQSNNDPDQPGGAPDTGDPTMQVIETAIDNWVNRHLRNSPVSGIVEAWNHLNATLPDLKKYLLDGLSKL